MDPAGASRFCKIFRSPTTRTRVVVWIPVRVNTTVAEHIAAQVKSDPLYFWVETVKVMTQPSMASCGSTETTIEVNTKAGE